MTLRRLVYLVVLRPLIRWNYWLRYHRFAEDRWYWADSLALGWGFWDHTEDRHGRRTGTTIQG